MCVDVFVDRDEGKITIVRRTSFVRCSDTIARKFVFVWNVALNAVKKRWR